MHEDLMHLQPGMMIRPLMPHIAIDVNPGTIAEPLIVDVQVRMIGEQAVKFQLNQWAAEKLGRSLLQYAGVGGLPDAFPPPAHDGGIPTAYLRKIDPKQLPHCHLDRDVQTGEVVITTCDQAACDCCNPPEIKPGDMLYYDPATGHWVADFSEIATNAAAITAPEEDPEDPGDWFRKVMSIE